MSGAIARTLMAVAVIWGGACLAAGLVEMAARVWRWWR